MLTPDSAATFRSDASVRPPCATRRNTASRTRSLGEPEVITRANYHRRDNGDETEKAWSSTAYRRSTTTPGFGSVFSSVGQQFGALQNRLDLLPTCTWSLCPG